VSVDERARHELYPSIEHLIGAEKAETLMSLLPPVGWADVATKQDIDGLRAATKQDIDGLRAATKHDIEASELRLEAKLDRELSRSMRAMVFSCVGAMASMATINLMAIAFLR
jgi:hypothetical protein